MRREDDQQLWDLLGKARQPELSPFFARNVLREIRAGERKTTSWARWLSWRRLVPATAAAAAAVALAVGISVQPERTQKQDVAAVAEVELDDYYALLEYVDMLEAEEEEYYL